jgi:hypothetical protein
VYVKPCWHNAMAALGLAVRAIRQLQAGLELWLAYLQLATQCSLQLAWMDDPLLEGGLTAAFLEATSLLFCMPVYIRFRFCCHQQLGV